MASGARKVIPIHWNTFVLSQEPVDEPIRRFVEAAGDEADRIVIREQGQVHHLGAEQARETATRAPSSRRDETPDTPPPPDLRDRLSGGRTVMDQ